MQGQESVPCIRADFHQAPRWRERKLSVLGRGKKRIVFIRALEWRHHQVVIGRIAIPAGRGLPDQGGMVRIESRGLDIHVATAVGCRRDGIGLSRQEDRPVRQADLRQLPDVPHQVRVRQGYGQPHPPIDRLRSRKFGGPVPSTSGEEEGRDGSDMGVAFHVQFFCKIQQIDIFAQ